MKLKFWARSTFWNSAAYDQAREDLRRANDREDYWARLLRVCAGVSANECLEGIFQARRDEIDALQRLGWNDIAKEKQADLDMRLWWMGKK